MMFLTGIFQVSSRNILLNRNYLVIRQGNSNSTLGKCEMADKFLVLIWLFTPIWFAL